MRLINERREEINNFLWNTLIITSFLSYEIHIYERYYQLMLIIVFALGCLLFIINIMDNKISSQYILILRKNISVYVLSIFLILSTLMASMKNNFITITDVIKIIVTILSLFIFYLLIPKLIIMDIDKKTNQLINYITFFSFIAIIIGLKGNFLMYVPTHYPRVASIFFDPNYFGTLAAVGVILSISKKGIYKLYALPNLAALYYSGSRAALIGLVFVLTIFYFYKKKITLNTIILFMLLEIATIIAIVALLNIDFFRLKQGLNSRVYLWGLSFDLIKREPFWGYGYGNVGDMLRALGAENASSHNSYLDYIIMYGIIPFILNGIVIVKALLKAMKNNVPHVIIKTVLFLLIVSNSISINLGGLGATSLLLTLFLGVCNLTEKTDFIH